MAAPGSPIATRCGALTGIEMRGPKFRGFTAERHQVAVPPPRQPRPDRAYRPRRRADHHASLAALEWLRADTLYVATGGGMGPETITAIEVLLEPPLPATPARRSSPPPTTTPPASAMPRVTRLSR